MGKYAEVNLPSEREESYFIERCWGNSVCGKKKKKKTRLSLHFCLTWKKNKKKKQKNKGTQEAGEMAQRRAVAVHVEDPGCLLAPWQLTAVCSSHSRVSAALYSPLRALCTHSARTSMHVNTHPCKINSSFKCKNWSVACLDESLGKVCMHLS